MRLLFAEAISKRFGGLIALDAVDLTIESGEIVSVIGPNGAGKTTLFNALTGFSPVDSGTIEFSGERIEDLPVHHITRRGIARTFQNIRLFGSMTALENVMVARHCRTHSELASALFHTRSFYREEEEIRRSALDHLGSVGLEKQVNTPAQQLSYGDQRRLEMARALATDPRLLLLDEPNAGLPPQESRGLMELIRRIRGDGVTILLIEHSMHLVMGVSDRVVVLDHGRKIADGRPGEVQKNPQVIEAYLGIPEVSRA